MLGRFGITQTFYFWYPESSILDQEKTEKLQLLKRNGRQLKQAAREFKVISTMIYSLCFLSCVLSRPVNGSRSYRLNLWPERVDGL